MQTIKTYRTDDNTPPPHRGQLPIKKHLLQYVIWRESLADDQPLSVPGLGPIAAALDMVLVTGEEFLRSNRWLTVDAYDARLLYIIQDIPHLKQDTLYVSDAGVSHFNRFLEQLLQDDLNSRVMAGKRNGLQEKIIIEHFLEETGLNEWLELDTLKKAQWRLRTHRRQPSIRGYNLMRNIHTPPLNTPDRPGRVHW